MTSTRKRTWTGPGGEDRTAWLVDYRDQAGKRRSRQFARKRDADAWRVEAEHQVATGVHTPNRDSITVAEAAKLRADRADANGRERSTVKRYREVHRLHIVPLIGATRLSQLTRPKVEQFRDDLARDRSPAMVRKAVRELASIISEAQSRGMVAQNVAAGVKVDSGKRHRAPVVIPSRAELRAMIAAAEGFERPLILLAITAALRSSELRGLRWVDVDTRAGTVAIEQRADQWGVIGSPKSAAGRRTVPIPPEVVSAMKRWKLEARPNAMGLCFPSARGTPYRHNNLLRRHFGPMQVRAGVCEQAVDKAGAPRVDDDGVPMLTGLYGMHALRHAAASNWIASGVDLKRLQTWLGHASVQVTLDTYGHLIADAGRDAALAFAASRDLWG